MNRFIDHEHATWRTPIKQRMFFRPSHVLRRKLLIFVLGIIIAMCVDPRNVTRIIERRHDLVVKTFCNLKVSTVVVFPVGTKDVDCQLFCFAPMDFQLFHCAHAMAHLSRIWEAVGRCC